MTQRRHPVGINDIQPSKGSKGNEEASEQFYEFYRTGPA